MALDIVGRLQREGVLVTLPVATASADGRRRELLLGSVISSLAALVVLSGD